eukprot:SAG31_NODE_7081_length_1794_cov_1.337463_1_plen_192_part_00
MTVVRAFFVSIYAFKPCREIGCDTVAGAVAGVARAYPKSHYWGTRMGSGHGYTLPANSSLATAGLDSNCNLQGGTIGGDDAAQRNALAHLFAVQVRLGLFDSPTQAAVNPFERLDEKNVGHQAHQQLALEAAQQSHVLLKNEGKRLPLPDPGKVGNILLVGPCWDVSKGEKHSCVCIKLLFIIIRLIHCCL